MPSNPQASVTVGISSRELASLIRSVIWARTHLGLELSRAQHAYSAAEDEYNKKFWSMIVDSHESRLSEVEDAWSFLKRELGA